MKTGQAAKHRGQYKMHGTDFLDIHDSFRSEASPLMSGIRD